MDVSYQCKPESITLFNSKRYLKHDEDIGIIGNQILIRYFRKISFFEKKSFYFTKNYTIQLDEKFSFYWKGLTVR